MLLFVLDTLLLHLDVVVLLHLDAVVLLLLLDVVDVLLLVLNIEVLSLVFLQCLL